MNLPNFVRKQAQAGFTLIELIVVIVILGILAATALPRMFDVSGQARIAKMQAALANVKSAKDTAHASWLIAGGLYGCANCAVGPAVQLSSAVTAETVAVPMIGGYPDVGGDGYVNTGTAAGGMAAALNNLGGDYIVTNAPNGGAASATALTISSDAAHPNCSITYTEAVQTAGTAGTATGAGTQPTLTTAPIIGTANLTTTNCS